MAENNEKPHLTVSEAAAILHVSPKTIGRWTEEGKLPHSWTLGGHRRFSTKEIRDLAATLRVEATRPEHEHAPAEEMGEVGSPGSFGHRPWFSDPGHLGHLHVGFGS